MDVPLSVAGRVILKDGNKYKRKIVNLKKTLCVRHVSINSIDVGIPQLAMHSGRELIGSDDLFYLYNAFKKFYNVSLKWDNNTIEIIENN